MRPAENQRNRTFICLQKEIQRTGRAALVRQLVRENHGVSLVEFALVAPILITLLIGTFWIGRAVSVYQALGRAAREGARVAVAPACATCGGATANDSTVDDAVTDALRAATIDTSNAGLRIAINRNEPLDSEDPANFQATGVAVTVSYPLQLNIPFTAQKATTLNLSSSVSMRREF